MEKLDSQNRDYKKRKLELYNTNEKERLKLAERLNKENMEKSEKKWGEVRNWVNKFRSKNIGRPFIPGTRRTKPLTIKDIPGLENNLRELKSEVESFKKPSYIGPDILDDDNSSTSSSSP